jgi:hypothetical protein
MKKRNMNYENLAKTAISAIFLLCAIAFAVSPASAGGEGVVFYGQGFENDGTTPVYFDGFNITIAGKEYNTTTSIAVDCCTYARENWYSLSLTNGTDINVGDLVTFYAVNNTRINNTISFNWDGNLNVLINVIFPPAGPLPQPALSPTAVWDNVGKGGYLFANETNEIRVNINNSGSANAGSFDVKLEIDNIYINTTNVASLLAGQNTNVTLTGYWPTTPGAKTVNITVDSGNTVTESNEGNNNYSASRTVYNNGYKGKKWTGGEDIVTKETYNITGNVKYSSGNSAYTSTNWNTITASWSSTDLPIPSTATVLSAKLYVYYNWDSTGGTFWYDQTVFNTVTYPAASATNYSDASLFGNYPNKFYGTLVYNVTPDFSKTGNTVTLGNGIMNRAVAIDGMILQVVYSDANEPQRKIWINEGFDILSADATKGTDTTETIAYAPFTGGPSINLAKVASARLIAVGPGAGDTTTGTKSNVLFNTNSHWNVLPPYKGTTQIGIADINVTSELGVSNNAAIQDNGDTGGMRAATTILVVEEKSQSLTVNKVVIPSSDTGKFNLQINGVTKATDVSNGGTTGQVQESIGSYTIGEVAGTGTSLSNYTTVISGDCAPYGTVTLAEGDKKVCTITNTRIPTLTVNKVVIPSSDTGKFNLQIDSVTKATDASNGGTTGQVQVSIGSHTVGEIAGTGTDLSLYTKVISGDCASDGIVILAAGDNKVCTITNMRGMKIDLGGSYDTEVGRHIMVPIKANNFEQFYGTVNMEFSYNKDDFNVVAVHSNSLSTVTAYNKDIPGTLSISAWNTAGVKGDVVLATVELEVKAGQGTNPELTLEVKLLQDIYGATIYAYTEKATVRIFNPGGNLKVDSATSAPASSLGNGLSAILNENGRPRHTGDNETVITAHVTDVGLGIDTVTVDLSAIGGSATTLMSGSYPNSGDYTVTAKATAGINGTYPFNVTATDNGGNTNTKKTTNSLTIYRRGDVVRNNVVNMGDALYIARYTVGLESPTNMNLFEFVGDVMDASGGSTYTVNMGDALYIARHSVGLEPAP